MVNVGDSARKELGQRPAAGHRVHPGPREIHPAWRGPTRSPAHRRRARIQSCMTATDRISKNAPPERWEVGPLIPGGHVMSSKRNGLPELDDLFRAADAHAAEAGDLDHAVGDLQEILRAAWRVLTPQQRRDLFAQPELADLAGLPEYEPLIGHLARPGASGSGAG